MVWFQCEDCGENLKKPKLSNHFRGCSASKLSCIDCGVVFDRISVQQHTSCVTEAEKYGPKGVVNNLSTQKPKTAPVQSSGDLDLKFGLSTRPPWACSICNVKATSEEALSLHSEGKKHRNKVKASVAKVNGTGTVNSLVAETKSAAIPADDKKPTKQAAVVDAPVAVKKRKSNQHENGAATPTSVSQVTDPKNASIADGAGEVGGLKQQKKKNKGAESAVASVPGAAEHEAVIAQENGKNQKKSKKSKDDSFPTVVSGERDTADGKLVKENIVPQQVVIPVIEVRHVKEGKHRKSQDQDVIRADGLTESDTSTHAQRKTKVKKSKKRKDDSSTDHLEGLTLDDHSKGGTVKPKDDKGGRKKKSKR